MTAAVIALGANLGDPQAALAGAMDALAATPGITLTARSSIYRTAPVGGPEQPDYLNAVALIYTDLLPADLLAVCHRIEASWDRTREVRWGPRTLDLDVITYGDLISADPLLTLPHPRAHERAFVLVPWLEVDPQAVIPGRGSLAQLLAGIGAEGVLRA